MRFLLASASAATLILAVGCGAPKPSLTGTWTSSLPDLPGSTMESTFSGKDAVKMVVSGEQAGVKMKATVDGTYTLEGETLTMQFTKADVKFEGLTADQEKQMAGFKSDMDKGFLEQMNKDAKGTIKWVDNNTVEMTSGGKTATMKRKV